MLLNISLIRLLIYIFFVLPKFVVWPLLFLYKYYVRKKGIKNDILTRITKYFKCLFLQKFRGKGYFELLYNNLNDKDKIKEKLLSILSTEFFKTTEQSIEEFRAEYPQEWEEILYIGQKTFGDSCTSLLSPSIFLKYLLDDLEKETKIVKKMENKECVWKKKG